MAPGDDSTEKVNHLFTFILQPCPNLKMFDFLGHVHYCFRGVIKLDFTSNRYLNRIRLDMPHCRYYTFAHQPGKYWRNIDEEIIMTQQERFFYSVDLAWDVDKKYIEVQLAGVGS